MSRIAEQVLVYAIVVGLVVIGCGILKTGDTVIGGSALAAAFLVSGSYFFVRKVRPQLLAARRFRNCLLTLGFDSFEASRDQKKYAQWLIRQHGNTDFACIVSDLLSRSDRFGDTLAGDVTESGQGFNFGMFVLGVLAPMGELDIAREGGLNTEAIRKALLEKEPHVSLAIQQALEDTPLDCSRIGSSYRISIDADDVLHENFPVNLTRLMNALHQTST